MMKPKLVNKPNTYAYSAIQAKYAHGVPLSCDELHHLNKYQRQLSSREFDPILNYYLKSYAHQHNEHSFLLSAEITAETVAKLKKRLHMSLGGQAAHVELKMRPEQFLQFRALTMNELILYHGNQLLTGAPFHAGGIPHLILFQWGPYFGAAKYVVLAEEKALKSNVMVYFEDMGERLLNECALDYLHRLQDVLRRQQQLLPSMQPRSQPAAQQLTPQKTYFQTPRLTLRNVPTNPQENPA